MRKQDDKSLTGVLKSVGHFFEMLGSVADQAAERPSGKRVKAVYGFRVRSADGKPFFESFGNVKPDAGGAAIDESHEPLVDVFDEGDHVRLVAELPGVEAGDIHFEIADQVLRLRARRAERRYERDVDLPCAVLAEQAQTAYRNGIFELKLPKA